MTLLVVRPRALLGRAEPLRATRGGKRELLPCQSARREPARVAIISPPPPHAGPTICRRPGRLGITPSSAFAPRVNTPRSWRSGAPGMRTKRSGSLVVPGTHASYGHIRKGKEFLLGMSGSAVLVAGHAHQDDGQSHAERPDDYCECNPSIGHRVFLHSKSEDPPCPLVSPRTNGHHASTSCSSQTCT